MKRILLLAAGALGTAGMIALAAPASADAPQPSPLDKLGNSEVVKTFLYGNCNGAQVCADDPAKVSHPGVFNQFDFFRGEPRGAARGVQKQHRQILRGRHWSVRHGRHSRVRVVPFPGPEALRCTTFSLSPAKAWAADTSPASSTHATRPTRAKQSRTATPANSSWTWSPIQPGDADQEGVAGPAIESSGATRLALRPSVDLLHGRRRRPSR